MRAYYEITEAIKSQLLSQQVNIVKIGDTAAVDLDKHGIYPLAHMIIEEARIGMQTIEFDISIILADLVDFNKESEKDKEPFYGNDNRQDALNAMLHEANIFIQHLMRGDMFKSNYQVTTEPSAQPFVNRFNNLLAGWMLSFSVQVPNIDTSVC